MSITSMFEFEFYLDSLKSYEIEVPRLRLWSHNLQTETDGHATNTLEKGQRNSCDLQNTEDKYYFVLVCPW